MEYNVIKLFETKEKNRKDNLIIIEPDEYYETLEKLKIPNEFISSCQVKPFFDVEIYNDKIITYNETSVILKILQDIQNILNLNNSRDIYILRRTPRNVEHNNKFYDKYSYHFIIDGIRINYNTLLNLIKSKNFKDNEPFDLSIYKDNSGLFPIYSYTKLNKKNNDIVCVPKLVPFDLFKGELNEIDITKYLASYIKEDFLDYDIKFNIKKIEIINKDNNNEDNDYDNDENHNKYNRLVELIKLISSDRSECFDSWINFNWCIINICNKENISQRKCSELIHQFSKLSKNKYNENDVDNWIDKNYDNVREKGYRWNYLFNTCIKEDNPKYYEIISKSYYNIKKEFEINNAKIIYPPQIISLNKDGFYEIQSINNFVKSWKHIKVYIKETNKKGEIYYNKKTFVEEWLNDSKIRIFEKNIFKPPPLIKKDYEFNCWIDFKIANEPLIKTERNFFKEWCDFGYNLIGNKKYNDLIIARYAQRIQNPAKRTFLCVVYYGEERIGKNKFIEPIKKIMDNYYQELDSAKKLYEKHSLYEFQKLFICVNEAQGIDNFSNADILKTRITEPKVAINPKGITPYDIDNLCDYDMTTNNFNVIKITDDSNDRFFQVECTKYYKGNTKFFNDYIDNIINNPIALRQIYEGLINFDIKSIVPSGNFQKDKPKTEIEEQVKEQNRDKILWFLEEFIRKYILIHKGKSDFEIIKYNNQKIFDKWKEWLKECNITSMEKLDKHKFGIKLNIIIKNKFEPDTIIKDNKHSLTIINTKLLASYFKLEDLKPNFIEDE